ncbi:MAG: hypothetical protein GY711_22245 [bacterium]|nr:hypothetical protein [bacterium]
MTFDRPPLLLSLPCLPWFVVTATAGAQVEFDPSAPVAAAMGAQIWAAADMDLDEDIDLVATESGTLRILENDGSGSFAETASVPMPAGSNRREIVVGDLNGDCRQDLLVVAQSSSVVLDDGAGGYTVSPFGHSLGSGFNHVYLLDVDGDDDLDVVSKQAILLNDGAGTFTLGTSQPAGQAQEVAIGDVNEDGIVDLVAVRAGTPNLTVHLGNGSGGFGLAGSATLALTDPVDIALADCTGNGHLDVVAMGTDVDDNIRDRVRLYRGSGTGTFQITSATILDIDIIDLLVADFNGDGASDVFAGIWVGLVFAIMSNGTGGFTYDYDTDASFYFAFTHGDLDGDGLAEFTTNDEVYPNRSIEWQYAPVTGNWYTLLSPRGWIAAEQRAVALGGHLATVDSAPENQWITANFTRAFIGYTDVYNEGQWTWTSGAPPGYENWAPGEPDDVGDADFCVLGNDGRWRDEPASAERHALVELVSLDLDQNGRPDTAEIALGWAEDINGDGVLDSFISPYYCTTNANSSGLPAQIAIHGTPAVGVDTLHLEVTDLPLGRFGYFLMSDSQGFIPMVGGGQGNLCLGLPLVRFASDVLSSGTDGVMTYTPNLVNVPGGTVVDPGTSWNFQCWFRDQNPGPTSNLSNGARVTFSADPRPTASFAPPCTGLLEQSIQFDIAVELSWAYHEDVVIPYTVSGTGTHGVDWRVESPNPLVVPAGQTSQIVTITVAQDGATEPTETGRIELTPSSTVRPGAPSGYELQIRNDD